MSSFGQRTHRNRWKEEETRKRKGPETRAETKELRGVAGNLQDVNVYSAPYPRHAPSPQLSVLQAARSQALCAAWVDCTAWYSIISLLPLIAQKEKPSYPRP